MTLSNTPLPPSLKIAIGQMNAVVGGFAENQERILNTAERAFAQGAQILVLPEMVIGGYPAEDLWLDSQFLDSCDNSLHQLAERTPLPLLLGHPLRDAHGSLFNSASWIAEGRVQARYHKRALPNVSVFDEKRYFQAGTEPTVITLNQARLLLLICEDVWSRELMLANHAQLAGQVDMVVVINASPFSQYKATQRRKVVAEAAQRFDRPVLYVNAVGAQDELVFDGGSFAVSASGKICQQLPWFEESLGYINGHFNTLTRHWEFRDAPMANRPPITPLPDATDLIHHALIFGLRDYWHKNKLKGAWIGLSGGIDSAVTLAIAVQALGAEQVFAVSMPSPYTADMSVVDARALATALGVVYHELPIQAPMAVFAEMLAPLFVDKPPDVTEENLQARIRGVLLMALANKLGGGVINTSNKSEMAMGYGTLYGDMVGAFALLKDVYKGEVYALANAINRQQEVIPKRIISRPPSAELRPNQTDQDSLPPYEILDAVLYHHLELGMSHAQLIAYLHESPSQTSGWNAAIITQVFRHLRLNEYKRRQSAIGVRLSERAFGKDRRYPISHQFRSEAGLLPGKP
jgi:NAD+ synthase (glutamine-hydrolysing)